MATSYPYVTDAELRAQYQKTDQIHSQRVLRILMWLSFPLLYMDFSILGLGQSFLMVGIVRVLAGGYAWWMLRSIQRAMPLARLEKHLFYWVSLVMISQLLSNFLSPLSYLGHFVIDAWICVITSLVLPLRVGYLKHLAFAYLFVATALCLTKIFPSLVHQMTVLAILLLSTYTGQVLANYLRQLRLKLLSAEFELQRKEITDPLTGVVNRRELMRLMVNEMQRHLRLQKMLSVLIFDIEHLKQINSQFGAGTADVVLVEVVKRMQRATRNYDILARYGTEEFVVLLPEATAEIAERIAHRMLHTISAMPITAASKEVKITARVGIAAMQETDTVEVLLHRAEADLQLANHSDSAPVERHAAMVFA